MSNAAFLIMIPAALFAFSCRSKERPLADAPFITSATYQHTQYNGRRQPVEAKAAKDDAPPFIVTYFRSEKDVERGLNGSGEAPAEVGDYYAKVERPGGNGYRAGGAIKIEYHIQKAFIDITASPVQKFPHDGRPKEVIVRAEPPATLSVSYTEADSGRLLDAPPAEKGRYLVKVVFPGNEHYLGASRDITLWIE